MPYGYGRLLGKGAGPLVEMHKHGAFGTNGDDLAFVDCEVYPRSYGHGWGWGQNNDITAIDCYIEGEIRSTNAMLKETTGPMREADYENYWTKERIKPGMMVSLHEDTFRSYPHPYKPKGNQPGTVKLLGCTVKNMSSGTAMGGTYKGDVFVSNMTTIGNTQRGHAVPPNTRIVNSRSDIRYAPALNLWKAHNTTVDLTILPSPVSGKIIRHRLSNHTPYRKAAAFITGEGHEITLKAQGDLKLREPMPIVVGYAKPFRIKNTNNVELKNTTGLPIILTENTRDCTIVTNGEVRDEGQNNEIQHISQ